MQLKGRNTFFARDEQLWTARASSSLPVPVSPAMSTVMLLEATRRVTRSRSSIDSETHTKPSCCSGNGSGQIADFSLSATAARCRVRPLAMRRWSARSVVRADCWLRGRTTTVMSRSRSVPRAKVMQSSGG